jgi:hypothetical protein
MVYTVIVRWVVLAKVKEVMCFVYYWVPDGTAIYRYTDIQGCAD